MTDLYPDLYPGVHAGAMQVVWWAAARGAHVLILIERSLVPLFLLVTDLCLVVPCCAYRRDVGGGRQLEAHMYDGVTNYAIKVKESWEEQEARLEAFAQELEGEEAAEEAAAKERNKETTPLIKSCVEEMMLLRHKPVHIITVYGRERAELPWPWRPLP